VKKILAAIFLVFAFLVYDHYAWEPKQAVLVGAHEVVGDVQALNGEDVPSDALAAFHESVVSVLVYGGSNISPNLVRRLSEYGMGTVIDDHLVLTCYHLTDTLQMTDPNFDVRKITVDVTDGVTNYRAAVVDFDSDADLLLLKVFDDPERFIKKALPVGPTDFNARAKEQFFSFSVARDVRTGTTFGSIYVRHDRFIGYSDIDLNGRRVKNAPVVQGKIIEGFSGSPLIDSNGLFRGIDRGKLFTVPQTFLVSISDAEAFLKRNNIRLFNK